MEASGFGRFNGPRGGPKPNLAFGKPVSSTDAFPTREPALAAAAPLQQPQPQLQPLPQASASQPLQQLPWRPSSHPPQVIHQKSTSVNSIQQSSPDAFVNTANCVGTSSPLSAKFQGLKRTRSPPISSTDSLISVSYSAENNNEREMEAKAKRLARFRAELSEPAESLSDFSRKTLSGSDDIQYGPKTVKLPLSDSKKLEDTLHGGSLADYEALESHTAMHGLCPDMCPESEREERERKGDLDKYERLDGERNQTSISLAVKKYTRTAEHDADLIRPLPVLRRTVDYLLDLLNQPYDDQFLGLYNFLWDRMRAIRMDLRMQHIFNHDAIHMLEKMIRLHIIAMHELSEKKKGEGFSEGFDAHLNIEQMNKTSVELFQMYDDHRKKGLILPTEKEFRGYYALLKLDKHPGYRVEPAELSLDLAKMTPEVRCTSDILFARDVARACRTTNFIAFFRLARKATYLQACLMHAHFSKLRTQALASLHSGLQSNQGIPIAQVVMWLAMEGENIEGLLEYHGFSTKIFEEPYMVKEGPFINGSVDYPTKCSQLVKLKGSKRIVDDVCHGQTLASPDEEQTSRSDAADMFDQGKMVDHATGPCVDVTDDGMLDYEFDYADDTFVQPKMVIEAPSLSFGGNVAEEQIEVHSGEVLDVVANEEFYKHPSSGDKPQCEYDHKDGFSNEFVPLNVNKRNGQVVAPEISQLVLPPENSLQDEQAMTSYSDTTRMMVDESDETVRARLKLILRTWKRRSSKKKEMRERRQSLADAALSSLSIGPSVHQNEAQNYAAGVLKIDYVVRERHFRHKISWSRFNTSKVVGPILRRRNPFATCLLWKLVLCLQTNDKEGKSYQLVSSWLYRKLMGTRRENDDELVISSSNLSVWKRRQLDCQTEEGCLQSYWCYSVVREVVSDSNTPAALDEIMGGSSAVIFLVSEDIPWGLQKARLEKILAPVPSGSSLPLLIVSTDAYRTDSRSIITNCLELQCLDKTIISDYSIVFLEENVLPERAEGFFSDDHLERGLLWLAENSPIQPSIHLVRTRDLVLGFLNSSLTALENLKLSEVEPDCCVSLFNQALDLAIEEIHTAADSNKSHWPCSEIDLLKDSPYDSGILSILPSTDWSSAARIQPLIAALGRCKLPHFLDNLSWSDQGLEGGNDLMVQKSALERCLLDYLAFTCRFAGGNLAAKEASIMIQRGTGLELRDNRYHIAPRWVDIFSRIYRWRLAGLSTGKFAFAYVPDGGTSALAKPRTPDSRWQSTAGLSAPRGVVQHLHASLTRLTLDELIGVSCIVSPAPRQKTANGGKSAEDFLADNVSTGAEPKEITSNGIDAGQLSSSPGDESERSRRVDGGRRSALPKMGELEALLEECNRQQNMNAGKLAVYF